LGTDGLEQRIFPIFKGLDVKMGILILEDGKDTMSRNIGYLTSKVAQRARKAKVSLIPAGKLKSLVYTVVLRMFWTVITGEYMSHD